MSNYNLEEQKKGCVLQCSYIIWSGGDKPGEGFSIIPGPQALLPLSISLSCPSSLKYLPELLFVFVFCVQTPPAFHNRLSGCSLSFFSLIYPFISFISVSTFLSFLLSPVLSLFHSLHLRVFSLSLSQPPCVQVSLCLSYPFPPLYGAFLPRALGASPASLPVSMSLSKVFDGPLREAGQSEGRRDGRAEEGEERQERRREEERGVPHV